MIGKRETEHKTVRTGQRPSLDWASIDWTKISKDVKKWQQEIFRLKFELDAMKVAHPVLMSRGC